MSLDQVFEQKVSREGPKAFTIYNTDHPSQVHEQTKTENYWRSSTKGPYEVIGPTRIRLFDTVVWLSNKQEKDFTAILELPSDWSLWRPEERKVDFMIGELNHNVYMDTLGIGVKGKYKGLHSSSSVDVTSERGLVVRAAQTQKYDCFTLAWHQDPESMAAAGATAMGYWFVTQTSFAADALEVPTPSEKVANFTVAVA